MKEFESKFLGTRDESYVEPTYVGFLVQRGEVQPGGAGEPAWDKEMTVCTTTAFSNQMAKWSGLGSEVVDPKYTDPSLTSPLPLRSIGEWGEDVAHSSEIKLLPAKNESKGRARDGLVQAVSSLQAESHRGRGAAVSGG